MAPPASRWSTIPTPTPSWWSDRCNSIGGPLRAATAPATHRLRSTPGRFRSACGDGQFPGDHPQPAAVGRDPGVQSSPGIQFRRPVWRDRRSEHAGIERSDRHASDHHAIGSAYKTATLYTDADHNGIPSAGDTLLYGFDFTIPATRPSKPSARWTRPTPTRRWWSERCSSARGRLPAATPPATRRSRPISGRLRPVSV